MHKLNRGVGTDYRHIVYDILGNIVVFFLCHGVFYGLGMENLSILRTGLVALCFLWFYILMCKNSKLYDKTTFVYTDRVIRRVSVAFIMSMCLTATIMYFAGRAQANRNFYFSYFIGSYAEFLLLSYVAYKRNKIESSHMRTLFIGTKKNYDKFLRFLKKTNLSIYLVGFVKYERNDAQEELASQYIGFVENGKLENILHKHTVDQVYLMQEKGQSQSMHKCLDLCSDIGVVAHVVIPPMQHSASYVYSIGTYPVISYHMVSLDALQSMIKRTMDILGSLLGIIVSMPILLVAAMAIKLDSEGPVFFNQTRIGRSGREFKIHKLRSMCSDAEAKKKALANQNEMKGGFLFKIQNDPRVTRVGRVLRKTSIDELPQFFNVLKGEMSLVGTRPPTRSEVDLYERHHWRRLSIKPGITGLWQTSGRNKIIDFEEVVAMDTEYIENWSIWMDIKMLLKTVGVLLTRKGAS